MNIEELLENDNLDDFEALRKQALEKKIAVLGNGVFLRGLIEFSNVCVKNCRYCGIRSDNKEVRRYTYSNEQVLKVVLKAYNAGFGSVVIQSGENTSPDFVNKISNLLKLISEKTNNNIRVTLSCGEQSKETYKTWLDCGCSRYLLRFETSNPELYKKIHPDDSNHDFDKRIQALATLKDLGYQVGSGMLIGVPFQTIKDQANDLLFLKELDIDMVGMGPYIEHHGTSLDAESSFSKEKRVELTLKSISILRLLMNDINIASTTALETLREDGLLKGLLAGANVFMPNMIASDFNKEYSLYDGKRSVFFTNLSAIEEQLKQNNINIEYNKWGDSKHFQNRVRR